MLQGNTPVKYKIGKYFTILRGKGKRKNEQWNILHCEYKSEAFDERW